MKKIEPAKPAAPRPEPKAEVDGTVVWDKSEAGWQLPESSEAAPRAKPERAPNHRTGRQPSVRPTEPGDGGFGAGL